MALSSGAREFESVTLGVLADAFEVLQELSGQPLEVAAAADVARLGRWARPHYVRYVGLRAVEAEKVGEKVEVDKFRIPGEKLAEFSRALVAPRSEPVEFDPDLKLDLRGLTGAKISPAAVEILSPFLSGL